MLAATAAATTNTGISAGGQRQTERVVPEARAQGNGQRQGEGKHNFFDKFRAHDQFASKVEKRLIELRDPTSVAFGLCQYTRVSPTSRLFRLCQNRLHLSV